MTDLSNDAYGHSISMSSDGVLDSYYVGEAIVYTFPTGTPQAVAYLSIAKQTNLAQFSAARLDFILSRYSRDTQIQLLTMYVAAQRGGLTNRASYIAQLLDWVNSIVSYAALYFAQVQALTDPQDVVAKLWDFTQIPNDPGITMLAAIQIAN